MENNGYNNFAEFYDCLMSDVDYTALAEYFHDLIGMPRTPRSAESTGILLDLACGTGTLTALMAERGWDVIGVDSSTEMLSKAKHHDKISYICQDMTKLDLYGTIDAAICSLDGLNHLRDQNALLKTLERLSLFMNPEGVLVFDMNTVYKHETILADNIFVKETDGVYCIWRNSYRGEGIVDIMLDIFADCGSGEYKRFAVEIRERAHDLKAICDLCRQSGFEVIEQYDFMTKEKINPKSEKVVFVCKKAVKAV
jgi:SAM-dependent methyltransferase